VISHAEAVVARQVAMATGRPRVSVVIPTYNEAANLPHVFAELPPGLHELIVVDGRSTDGSIEVARALVPHVKIVRQTRRGKGNALVCGFAAVTGDIVVTLDADGSAHPAEIAAYVGALVAGADFAKGTRFANGGGSSDITRLRRAGNSCLNGMVNVLYGTRFTDLCYGYNAFWSTCFAALDLAPGEIADEMQWGDGFEIETIINTRIARAGLRIAEVGSYERTRIHGVSNLNAVTDGVRVLKAIMRERKRSGALPQHELIAYPRANSLEARPAIAAE
jgi:glycosyltransferase involved in cell wall biosynthesis